MINYCVVEIPASALFLHEEIMHRLLVSLPAFLFSQVGDVDKYLSYNTGPGDLFRAFAWAFPSVCRLGRAVLPTTIQKSLKWYKV